MTRLSFDKRHVQSTGLPHNFVTTRSREGKEGAAVDRLDNSVVGLDGSETEKSRET